MWCRVWCMLLGRGGGALPPSASRRRRARSPPRPRAPRSRRQRQWKPGWRCVLPLTRTPPTEGPRSPWGPVFSGHRSEIQVPKSFKAFFFAVFQCLPPLARPPRPLPPPVEPPFLCLRYLWGFLCLCLSPAVTHPHLTVGYVLIFFPSSKALLDQWRFAELYFHRVVLLWYFYTFPILFITPRGVLRVSHPTNQCSNP